MKTASGKPAGKEPRILIIDDETRIRDACLMVLGDRGYLAEAAADGQAGLRMIQEKHFDIILVDLMMPTISGFDVLAQVREHHPDTVVIVITGYATLEHSIEAMKKGAFDFIPKPFTPDQLRAVVDKSLRYTKALQDISESKSRLRVMVNRLVDGVMTTDSNRRIVQANPSFLKMIGYHGEEVVGRLIDEVIELPQLKEAIDQALAMEPETFSEITGEIHVGEEGTEEEKFFSASCTPFRSRTNENLGTITVLHDITTLKRMDQMKSDFVSLVSHEIRSPMNSLLAQLKVVLDGLAGEVTAKQREILQRASDKILNLNNMVTELLDLSRIESGLIAHEKEPVDLAPLLTEQQTFHSPAAKAKKLLLRLECPSSLPPVMANRQNLEEVFANLITNAIKYSPPDGYITVSASASSESLKVEVRDTGYGIPEEDLTRVFNRFYRVKDANTREIQGTGLGLALVKSIIESHQGRISVQSVVGKGTTFSVLLPLKSF